MHLESVYSDSYSFTLPEARQVSAEGRRLVGLNTEAVDDPWCSSDVMADECFRCSNVVAGLLFVLMATHCDDASVHKLSAGTSRRH